MVTINGDKGKFARVCVEIDLSKPVIKRVKIEDQWQSVEYESLHLICGRCNCYGHTQRTCSVEEESSMQGRAQTTAAEGVETVGVKLNTVAENPINSGGFSNSNQQIHANDREWISVVNRRKSRVNQSPIKGKSNVQAEKRVQVQDVTQRAWEVKHDHVTSMLTPLKVGGESLKNNVDTSVQPNGPKLMVSAVKPNNIVKGGRFMFSSKQALKLKKLSPPKGRSKRARPSSLNSSPVQQQSNSENHAMPPKNTNVVVEGREEGEIVVPEVTKNNTPRKGGT